MLLHTIVSAKLLQPDSFVSKVLSVFDPPAKDPSVQTPSASVSEQPLTSGEVDTPVVTRLRALAHFLC